MHFGNPEELSLIALHRWGAIIGGSVLQFVDPQQGRISLAVAGSRGGARGARPPFPLFLDQTEARRAEKIFSGDRPPTPLSQGLDTTLSSSLLTLVIKFSTSTIIADDTIMIMVTYDCLCSS